MIFSTNKGGLRGELTVPGDKSISHRSVMFGAISRGLTEIDGFLQGPTACLRSPAFSTWAFLLKTGETGFWYTETGCGG